MLAEKAEHETARYKQELSDIKSHNLKIESKRYEGSNILSDKFEV